VTRGVLVVEYNAVPLDFRVWKEARSNACALFWEFLFSWWI